LAGAAPAEYRASYLELIVDVLHARQAGYLFAKPFALALITGISLQRDHPFIDVGLHRSPSESFILRQFVPDLLCERPILRWSAFRWMIVSTAVGSGQLRIDSGVGLF